MSTQVEEKVVIDDPAALVAAHEKAKADLVALRAELKGLQKEYDEAKTQLDALSPESLEKMKKKAISAELKSRLESEGVANVDGVLKYLDLDGVDYDEEDNLTGVDEKLETLRTDLPLLFNKKARAGASGADIHADKPANIQKNTTEAQVDALFGRR